MIITMLTSLLYILGVSNSDNLNKIASGRKARQKRLIKLGLLPKDHMKVW